MDWIRFWYPSTHSPTDVSLHLLSHHLFIGVPRGEILTVCEFFATKLVVNEFAAYSALQNLMKYGPNPLSPRAYTICSYGLCGFSNFGSLGIQIGVLSALAPSRRKVIARIAFSAMICGFLSTLQTAGIV